MKKAIQKTAKATGDLISDKIADKTTKVSRCLPQNSSKTVEKNIKFDTEI